MPNVLRLSFHSCFIYCKRYNLYTYVHLPGLCIFHFLLASAVMKYFLSITVAMLVVESAKSVETGGHKVVFYFGYFPHYFQFGVRNLFSDLWANTYKNNAVSFLICFLNKAANSSSFITNSGCWALMTLVTFATVISYGTLYNMSLGSSGCDL